jgi:hypothetical protein
VSADAPTGEIPGVRDARDRVRDRAEKAGLPPGFAAEKADQAARRLDRNIRDGKVNRPR